MLQTDLRDGGLANIHSYRLKLGVGGQVQLVVPQQLEERKHLNLLPLLKESDPLDHLKL